MAGMLNNRSIPTKFEAWYRAKLGGQFHECPQCGARLRALQTPKCDECSVPMYPMWTVRDGRGRIRGEVAGAGHSDALESARQSIAYSQLHSFTVTEAY